MEQGTRANLYIYTFEIKGSAKEYFHLRAVIVVINFTS